MPMPAGTFSHSRLVPDINVLREGDGWSLLCALTRSAVQGLAEDDRYVIHELYWKDRSHGAIAHRLGVSWQLIKQTEQRSLAEIERQIAPIVHFVWNGGASA